MENQDFSKFRNPLDILRVLFRRKWLFIAPIFAGLVIGIMACFLTPPKYRSSTTILVEEEKIINPLIKNLAVSTTASQRIQSIREVVLGWNSLVELTNKLNLAKNITTQLEFEGFITNLRNNIDVFMRRPNIIRISYIGGDPQMTQLITQTITEILIEKNMQSQTRETDVAIRFIKEQLAIYKRKVKESEINQLEEKLKALLVDSTDKHPMVIDLRGRLQVSQKELESGNFEVPKTETALDDTARGVLKRELDSIIEEEDSIFPGSSVFAGESDQDINRAIYKLLLMDKVEVSSARDINVNKRIYQMLLQRLETAKITQRLEASKEGTRYTVIEPPRLPLKPTKPNKFNLIVMGLFLGGAAGTGLVFGREFLDHSFLDIEDAKNSLNSPVLGAISRITTQDEIDKEKTRNISLAVAFLVVSFSLITVTMLMSMIKR
ncbi:MAG: GNVR domain-containing protein [Candidatus Omnitrophota bacterium]